MFRSALTLAFPPKKVNLGKRPRIKYKIPQHDQLNVIMNVDKQSDSLHPLAKQYCYLLRKYRNLKSRTVTKVEHKKPPLLIWHLFTRLIHFSSNRLYVGCTDLWNRKSTDGTFVFLVAGYSVIASVQFALLRRKHCSATEEQRRVVLFTLLSEGVPGAIEDHTFSKTRR